MEIIGFVALAVGLVALAWAWACSDAIRKQHNRINSLAQEFRRSAEQTAPSDPTTVECPPQRAIEEPPAVAGPLPQEEVTVGEPPEAPVLIPESQVSTAEDVEPVAREPKLPQPVTPSEQQKRPPLEAATSLLLYTDRQKWAKLEEKLGKQWTIWVGAVVLILSAGFFVKYAFEHEWLGEGTRVILGVAAGVAVIVAGRHCLKRNMDAFGQGLVGTGLAILYVSLYAAYGFYDLLGQPTTFALMTLVTIGGMVFAVTHDTKAVSFLAVLGGLITPLMLRTGRDPRDGLFAYLLLLDLGVLGVAFFKRWRPLDVLAFAGTWVIFTLWYLTFRGSPTYSMAATMLWLAAFYVVFLILPFVYHLRLTTPIVGERFFLAVSNAAGMFGLTYSVLRATHKHVLGLVTLAMSASYLALGTITRRRLRDDERATFGFIAMSVMFLTIAIPIHLDFHGVTIAWAAQAPLLLYLAYKYSYFPVRAGALVSLTLAAGRIFTIHWPLHSKEFTPFINQHFGTAIFVALAGGVYASIHHWQRKDARPEDQKLKIWTAIASAYLALAVINVELWQWLDLSARDHAKCWACGFACAAGAAAFLVVGTKLSCAQARLAGFVALAAAGVLETWDYTMGMHESYVLIFNGRFLATLATIAVVFCYAVVYRGQSAVWRPDEKIMSTPLFGAGIVLLVVFTSFETWQWLALRNYFYIARCLLPPIWVVGAAGCLTAGLTLKSFRLRQTGLAVLLVAGLLAAIGYGYRLDDKYALFLNGYFAAGIVVVLMVYAYSATLRRLHHLCQPDEEFAAKILYGIAVAALWILLSAETYMYFDRAFADRERAKWVAQMSLSVVWGVYAIALLAVGFWRSVRNLRLAALGLFGLTAIKLVLVDMAQVEEVYRIISFFVLGTLMIGASYLYHKVEKRLSAATSDQ